MDRLRKRSMPELEPGPARRRHWSSGLRTWLRGAVFDLKISRPSRSQLPPPPNFASGSARNWKNDWNRPVPPIAKTPPTNRHCRQRWSRLIRHLLERFTALRKAFFESGHSMLDSHPSLSCSMACRETRDSMKNGTSGWTARCRKLSFRKP